jgi:hypothetical protein
MKMTESAESLVRFQYEDIAVSKMGKGVLGNQLSAD